MHDLNFAQFSFLNVISLYKFWIANRLYTQNKKNKLMADMSEEN